MNLFTKAIKNKLIANHNKQDGTKTFKAVLKLLLVYVDHGHFCVAIIPCGGS